MNKRSPECNFLLTDCNEYVMRKRNFVNLRCFSYSNSTWTKNHVYWTETSFMFGMERWQIFTENRKTYFYVTINVDKTLNVFITYIFWWKYFSFRKQLVPVKINEISKEQKK